MRKILITGGAGYIGSHCAFELLKRGYEVEIFDNLSTGHIEIIENLKKEGNLGFHKVDLCNRDELKKAFEKCGKVDAVIHFASFSQVGESVKNPQKYYNNNIIGALNLFGEMLSFEVKKLVFSSTAAIYGIPTSVPITEEHPKNPINTYGKTKLFIENILCDYDFAYDLKSVRLRYFNVAGANTENVTGEWHDVETHLIPNILNSTENKEFCIYGNDYDTKDGTCIRDYINVEDLADAHIRALEYLFSKEISQSINLGTGEGNSVKEVFSLCEEVIGKKIPQKICARRQGDPPVLIADNKKAYEILGWKPKRSLEHSIKTAYNWGNKLNLIKNK